MFLCEAELLPATKEQESVGTAANDACSLSGHAPVAEEGPIQISSGAGKH